MHVRLLFPNWLEFRDNCSIMNTVVTVNSGRGRDRTDIVSLVSVMLPQVIHRTTKHKHVSACTIQQHAVQ